MSLRKREDIGNWKRKHWLTLCGELTLEEAMDLFLTQATEWVDE
jgi:hypothetical protein